MGTGVVRRGWMIVGAVAGLMAAGGANAAEWSDIHGTEWGSGYEKIGKRYASGGQAVATPMPLAWSFALPSQPWFSSPVVAGGMVHLGTQDGKLYGWNAATGAMLWSYDSGEQPGASVPSVAGGILYVNVHGSTQQTVRALNAATGSLIWTCILTGNGGWLTATTTFGGRVAVGGSRANMLLAATGGVIWSATLDSAVASAPIMDVQRTIYCSESTYAYSLQNCDGSQQWSQLLTENVWAAATLGALLYAPSGNQVSAARVTAIDPNAGTVVWSYITPLGDYSTPAEDGSRVYFGCDDGKVRAVNAATGSLAWTYATGSAVRSAPAVVGGSVLVGSDNNKLYCLDSGNGALNWTYTFPNNNTALGYYPFISSSTGVGMISPAYSDGMVFAASGWGSGLWAFGTTPTGSPVASPTLSCSAVPPTCAGSPTRTLTPTITPTRTYTETATVTATFTTTQTFTMTHTLTLTATITETYTVTEIPTETATVTATATESPTQTFYPLNGLWLKCDGDLHLSGNGLAHLEDGPVVLVCCVQSPVRLRANVYNSAGELMARLADTILPVGYFTMWTWDGRGKDGRTVASGVYVIRWKIGERVGMTRIGAVH